MLLSALARCRCRAVRQFPDAPGRVDDCRTDLGRLGRRHRRLPSQMEAATHRTATPATIQACHAQKHRCCTGNVSLLQVAEIGNNTESAGQEHERPDINGKAKCHA